MTYEFTGELAARQAAASRQYNEAVEKYAPIHGLDTVAKDYHYWYEAVYEGDKLVLSSREYPKPYNDLLYFEHFAKKFITNSHFLETRLSQEFSGDRIDTDYIEGLLHEAKEAGFFTPGALIVYGTGTRRLIPPNSDGSPHHYRPPLNERVYVGSQVNLDRAERIRKWLERRAKEFAQALPTQFLAVPPLPVSEVPKVSEASYTLESICKRTTEAERKELAGKIDAIWNAVKQKTTNEDDYPAICTAVYKLVEWLGLINNGTIASQWKAALLSRYEVTISEGVGKYRVAKPSSGVFKQAVKSAFAFISTTYPLWTKNKRLPDIYQ